MTSIEQDKAIACLERAFKKCSKAGLMFCGMDGTIYFATKEAINATDDKDGYCKTANAVQNSDVSYDTGHVNTHGTYDDSGGW